MKVINYEKEKGMKGEAEIGTDLRDEKIIVML